jgi:hypothetical protein
MIDKIKNMLTDSVTDQFLKETVQFLKQDKIKELYDMLIDQRIYNNMEMQIKKHKEK